MALPSVVHLPNGKSLPVVSRDSWGLRGCLVGDKGEHGPMIIINSRDTEWLQHETLVHEIFHAIEFDLIEQGVYKSRLSEHRVEHLSTGLFQALYLSDLYRIR